MKLNKGAMFGLDARIALAIFGALSVISGAALYSAIQEAKVIQDVALFNEMTKATEQYLLDTGAYIPESTPSYAKLEIGNLYSNYKGVLNWKGPYFGTSSSANNNIFLSGFPYVIYVERRTKEKWSGTTLLTSSARGCSDSDCYMYANFFGSGAKYNEIENRFNRLDEKLDNGDGPTEGIVRATSDGTNIECYIRIFRDYNRMK